MKGINNKNSFKDLFLPSYRQISESSDKKLILSIFKITMAAILFVIVLQIFVRPYFLFTGVSSISLLLYHIFNNKVPSGHWIYQQLVLNLSGLVLNIPLLIYSFNKLPRKTWLLSIYYLAASALIGLAVGHYIYNWRDFLFFLHSNNVNNIDKLIIAVFGGVIYALLLSMVYGSSCTTGGTDLIVISLAIKHKKRIGIIDLLVLTWVFLTVSGIHYLIIDRNSSSDYIFYMTSSQIIGTLLFICVFCFMLDYLFPKNLKVLVIIITNKADEITEIIFNKEKYRHSFTKISCVGTYKKQKKDILLSVMQYFEYYKILDKIKKIDKDIFATVCKVKNITGKFNSYEEF